MQTMIVVIQTYHPGPASVSVHGEYRVREDLRVVRRLPVHTSPRLSRLRPVLGWPQCSEQSKLAAPWIT